MISNRVLLVMPKEDSYQYRSSDTKVFMRSKINEVLSYYGEVDILRFYYFIEDRLAYSLFKDREEMIKLTCFNNMDKLVAVKSGFVDESVMSIRAEMSSREDIKESLEKCKPPKMEDSSKATLRLLGDKRRYVVNSLIESGECTIVYFDKNNQFCNLKEPKIGDGRLVHVVNLNTGIEEFSYSGQYVDKELFLRIIKEGLRYV